MKNIKRKEHDEWAPILDRIANDRDQVAFSEFFDHFAPKVKAYSHSKQPGADIVAEELAQEVMIKVWDKAHTYNAKLASVSTWLFTMTRNCRIDQLRRTKHHLSLDADDVWYEEEDDADPFKAVQQLRTDNAVHDSLKSLPKEQFDVLRKVYLQGKTQQEAAKELKLPLGTVKSRIRLAIKKLEPVLRS